MTRHREEIHLQGVHVHGDLAHALGRIGVERHSRFPGQGADFPDGLDSAGLVVGMHHADQDGIGPEGSTHLIRVHPAGSVHRQDSHFKPLGLQKSAGGQHRGVLRGHGNEVPPAVLRAPHP